MVYLAEATPAPIRGSWLGPSLRRFVTVGDWLGSPTLRHLVQRTARCRLPPAMERGPPRFPEVWVVRLPSPEAVARTATTREGRAVEPYWAALIGGHPPCPVPLCHSSHLSASISDPS